MPGAWVDQGAKVPPRLSRAGAAGCSRTSMSSSRRRRRCRAPQIGQQTMVLDGVEMPVRPNIGIFTQPISFIGLPVVSGAGLDRRAKRCRSACRSSPRPGARTWRCASRAISKQAGVVRAPVATCREFDRWIKQGAGPGATPDKDAVRARGLGRARQAAAWPMGPAWSHIPNFVGADMAAWHLAQTDAWKRAKTVKTQSRPAADPDPPARALRGQDGLCAGALPDARISPICASTRRS